MWRSGIRHGDGYSSFLSGDTPKLRKILFISKINAILVVFIKIKDIKNGVAHKRGERTTEIEKR
jgi:hypothetical protein